MGERPDFNAPNASDPFQPDSQPRQAPADPNQQAGVVQPAQAQPGEGDWQSIRDAAAAFGYQFDASVTDDRAALVHLLRQAQSNRQTDFYAQLGRQLAPQAPAIQQYLQSQRPPQAAQTERPPWEAPEFDERWAGLVDRDAQTGLYVAKQGVPHEIAQKVNAFVEWKANYDRNPAAVLNAMVDARAKDIAAQTFREQFAEQNRQQTISQIVAENTSWLYQTDSTGRAVVNPVTGQYTATPVGARYMQHLRSVQQMGVTDPRAQDHLAKQLVRAEYAVAQQQTTASQQQQAADPQTRQAVGSPNRNPLQAGPPTQRRSNPAATEPAATGLTLHEMLRHAMREEGVTDADFAHLGE